MDTFPKLALDNARRLPGKIAIREKGYGIWQAYSWSRYVEETRDIALGLAAIGFARGDKTAVVGDNRPELYWAMLATQALGGIPVPLYQDSIEREMQYIVDHAEARFAVVEDQEQVDKLLHVKAECPHLQHVIYKDARGMRRYTDPCLLSLEALQELGRKFGREHPGYVRRGNRARGGVTTSRSSATRRAPRAGPRARCSRTGISSRRPRVPSRARGSPSPTRSWPTCPWRGSATTCSRSASPS